MRGQRRLMTVAAITLGASLFAAGGASAEPVRGGPAPVLIVDGVEYLPTKVTPSGTRHYETPDVAPEAAAVPDRGQVWAGHGADHLPCLAGIHWISNGNLLTVSHCLEPEATTTVPEATSTTVVAVTTPPVPTTVPEAPTTTAPAPSSTLPVTGRTASRAAHLALTALLCGALMLAASRRRY